MTNTAVGDAGKDAPHSAVREFPRMHTGAPPNDRPIPPEKLAPDRHFAAGVTASTTCPG